MGRSLAIKTIFALVAGAVLVAVCYYVIDRRVTWFIHDHIAFSQSFLEWPPRLSNWLKNTAAVVIVIVLLRCIWNPGGRGQTLLMAISADLIAATVLKQVLKWGFGRYWPTTWKPHLPSLVKTGDYGFHPFQQGLAYESFPSGHAMVVCSLMTLLWIASPRWRWVYGFVYGSVCVTLVLMNYHFVGDVIAGAVLGSIVGVYVARGFRLGVS